MTVCLWETVKGAIRLTIMIIPVTVRPKGRAFLSAVFKKLPRILLVSDSIMVIKEG